MAFNTDFFNQRRAGILLHPTSLPETPGNGDLGQQAYNFIHFLADSAITVWQMLPLGPPDDELSPYQCQSVHAGNPLLISIEFLVNKGWLATDSSPTTEPELELELKRLIEQGWLTENHHELVQRLEQRGLRDQFCLLPKRDVAMRYRLGRLKQARAGFEKNADEADRTAFAEFIEKNAEWLENYALFKALQAEHHEHLRVECLRALNDIHSHEALKARLSELCSVAGWWGWAPEHRDRDQEALKEARQRLKESVEQHRFEQFVFFSQWQDLKNYAHDKGIYLFGDIPIFVAHDSADVWANRNQFLLDGQGQPTVVAGVPPDYFSATGQRWGNPLYNWEALQADGFRWWISRLKSASVLFDLVRIDHFRGFEAYWAIPSHCETAIEGQWIKAPGHALFETLQNTGINISLVAEDLGVITHEVDALRERFHLPGMRVLQFAFGNDPKNPHLPHNHKEDNVVYTGTHDNNTTVGWFHELPDWEKQLVRDTLHTGDNMPWPLIETAYRSVGQLAVVPMQDILALDGYHRMNTPGTSSGNWRWRFDWSQVPSDVCGRLQHLAHSHGRI
jgi:4-alpha-glucanotransferase